MSGKFADSNVVLYTTSKDDRRADTAIGLVADGLVISVQVLNEAANVMSRKWKRPWAETLDLLNGLRSQCRIVPVDEATHRLGIEIAIRHRLSIYDSMIVAAALLAGCDTLYSEDMHAGLVIENRLRIVNPFTTA